MTEMQELKDRISKALASSTLFENGSTYQPALFPDSVEIPRPATMKEKIAAAEKIFETEIHGAYQNFRERLALAVPIGTLVKIIRPEYPVQRMNESYAEKIAAGQPPLQARTSSFIEIESDHDYGYYSYRLRVNLDNGRRYHIESLEIL